MEKSGLVFAGGGIKAACHIGVIKTLEEEKICRYSEIHN